MTKFVNLNSRTIPTDTGGDDPTDYSTSSRCGRTRVIFRNLEAELISLIGRADVVVGCVAWLTSEPILAALASVRGGVSIVVQKEDFLRPDIGHKLNWHARLRQMYQRLPKPPERHTFRNIVSSLSMCGDPSIDPVRCVGNHNRAKEPAFPRMHNKFLVFCRTVSTPPRSEWEFGELTVRPEAVWTGSFNLTRNATMSLENAVVMTDRSIVEAFFNEWGQIMALSEPLNWESEWCAPEWRIGS